MRIWARYFDVKGWTEALPRPLCVCKEIQNTPGYVSRGSLRQEETHCIFHYCLSGGGMVSYRGVDYRVPPEHGFLCVINDPDIAYFYPADGTWDWEFIWFGYDGGGSSEVTKDMVDAHGPVFSLPADSPYGRQFVRFGDAIDRPIETDRYEGAMFVHNLLMSLGHACESNDDRDRSELVRNTMMLLRESPPPLDVGELSARQHVSREHLSRVFHREAGVTLKDALSRQKSLSACQQLLNSDISVGELARELGYSSTSNFCRMFRTCTGMTPSAFRREQRRLAGYGSGLPALPLVRAEGGLQ